MIWILSVVILLFSTNTLNQQHSQNYGPYRHEIIKYQTCKGPKGGECGTVKINSIKNTSNIPFILDFSKDCPVTRARVTAGIVQNNNKSKTMLNYQINQPCDHFVLGPLLTTLFNVSQNCIIEKGHYEVNINMDELATKFLGSTFFYNTYFFKTIAHNKASNFFCIYSIMKVYKS